ncbi:hypothetical protein BC937DRAFT_91232 [Endogone sp. FLAS-F59071]|nr:hypothetical protein BC937DRAFT_91232 [Endogone sp. FLAS-F59071]|eukprot:RUS16418.1 hypothetical protein BC937DRAFT_91232 [Endogone sp. FLAS-F59071]
MGYLQPHFRAQVIPPSLALFAHTATDAGLEGDAVTDLKVGDARAEGGDHARRLVAKDHGRRDLEFADGAVHPVMHIRAADACDLDVHLDLCGWLGQGEER